MEAAARQRPVLEEFIQGRLLLLDLRKWIDSEGKQNNLWGFRGADLMFFLCKSSPPIGNVPS